MLSLRALFVVALIFARFDTLLAASSGRPVAAVFIAGKEYVRFSDWARANDFKMNWVKRDESLQIANQTTRIQLTVDSQEAQVNGVGVRLLFPLVSREGQAYLSRLDIRNTFEPILFPPRSRSGGSIRTICLDPGHGGKDPGNRVGSSQEKKYNLLLAEELGRQLINSGFKVTLTRTGDKFIELPDRPQIANRRNADLFISLHFNSFPQPTVKGAEVYCLTPAGAPSSNARGEGANYGSCTGNRMNARNMLLAYDVQKSITRKLGVEDRGVHRARFAVLRDALMPSILIEGGFMSHPTEGRKIFDPAYRRQMAQAIVEGILDYKRHVEPAS